ncbi:MAG: 5'-nucleotidase [Bacteroidota bacterium]
MLIKLRGYFLVSVLLFLGACTAKYNLVKSAREEYAINDKIAVDSNIVKAYLPYKKELDAEMNKIIGYTAVALTKKSNLPESVLGNFFADAVLAQAKKIDSTIDFALPTTNGGLRNDLAKGPITVANVFELMPFENEAVLFKLKGTDVLDLLKFIAASGGQPVSGLKMNINDKVPENIFINGKAFDINKDYQVLTSDYIASGGDDAKGFANPISKKVLGLKIRDAILKEVSAIHLDGKKINATLDGRITKN